ncbi:hypothetical protein DDZ13_12120 [Coraliomargarita sinensis]|uniref:Sialate O-acetylesterase domain-containing protein n=1 Tax=Coraliomargarita sinensis TaxID=2174842 RepID=A0A317ZGS2_9BACT|nr:hypothetical protein [Coraliomargarita sinensis]PXA03433.1 hypothetical protein DDZ13_12120 [Coraliomargarita sinensis]
MPKLPALFLLSLVLSGALSAAEKHLFILSGQSNMAALKPELSFTPAVEAEFGAENVTVVKDAQNGAAIRSWYEGTTNTRTSGRSRESWPLAWATNTGI